MNKGKWNELLRKYYFLGGFAFLLVFAIVFISRAQLDIPLDSQHKKAPLSEETMKNLEKSVLPSEGVTVPIKWGNLGMKMISQGVIDPEKFAALYKNRGGIDPYIKELLYNANNDNLNITPKNAGAILNLLWALGIGNKNAILDKGPMSDEHNGGAGNFASTGGWTLAKGDAMEHFSRHSFILLTKEQQTLVENVSKNIYRPCCNNATYFPDCNHGMAMLGLLELMASRGANKKEMYKTALQVNSYWFPDTYLTIATYLAQKGIKWQEADPKILLGKDFSSASGYRKISEQVTLPEKNKGGSCGV